MTWGRRKAMTAQIITAFTEEQTERLTGVTARRLRHWDRTGFFSPSFPDKENRGPFRRVYSFRDLLSLQVLRALRDDAGCSLQHLREVRDKLNHLGDDLWARTKLYVLNKKVVFYDETSGGLREPVSGQMVLQIPLLVVRDSMEDAVKKLTDRDDHEIGRIERKRNVSHNAAVVAGTRITVGAIKRLAEDGFAIHQILSEFPALTEADVQAALRYQSGRRAA
jgi:DNA-binding transcriptional MerR regulator